MKKLSFLSRMLGGVIAGFLSLSSAYAQGYPTQFSSCGSSPGADSACMPLGPSSCISAQFGQIKECAAPWTLGGYEMSGTRNACTNEITFESPDAASLTLAQYEAQQISRYCTTCGDRNNPYANIITLESLIASESLAMGLSEVLNAQYLSYLWFQNTGINLIDLTSIPDGTRIDRAYSYTYNGQTFLVNSSLDETGSIPASPLPFGYVFRGRLWVTTDPTIIPGLLPSYQALGAQIKEEWIPSYPPSTGQLPDQYKPDLGELYRRAFEILNESRPAGQQCISDANTCSLSACSDNNQGLFLRNCSLSGAATVSTAQELLTIVRDNNICGSPFYRYLDPSTGEYNATSSLNAPWVSGPTQTATDSLIGATYSKNYTYQDHSWESVLAWNNRTGNPTSAAGGQVFICSSTVNGCNGWVSQGETTECVGGTWTTVTVTGVPPNPDYTDVVCTGTIKGRVYFYNDCTAESVSFYKEDEPTRYEACTNTDYGTGTPQTCRIQFTLQQEDFCDTRRRVTDLTVGESCNPANFTAQDVAVEANFNVASGNRSPRPDYGTCTIPASRPSQRDSPGYRKDIYRTSCVCS